MSLSAMIITSEHINNDMLGEFINSLGGRLVPEESDSYVVSEGDSSIWVGIQDSKFAKDFYDEQTIQEWRSKLNGVPVSIIELELDHTDGSQLLYLRVAYEFAKKWNSILDDIDDEVISSEELTEKYINSIDDVDSNNKVH